MTEQERLQEIAERLNSLPAADWVVRMRENFEATGEYRLEDVMRLLGDQSRGVQITSDQLSGTMVTLA